MKISRVGMNVNPQFTGEKTKKALKNTAGAAAIAIASAVPATEADAQFFVPPPVQHYYYVPVVPNPVTTVPNCFVYGDVDNFDTDKSMSEVFSEIDSKIKENGSISMGEVVGMERDNWNKTHFYPYSNYQMQNTAANFKVLSNMYNEEGSNPNTINYSEYKNIMKSYMQYRNVANFIGLMQLLTIPRPVCPPPHHHRHMPPPPHHHRH